jgi:myo-inositol-1(or 4)-monophosphatase
MENKPKELEVAIEAALAAGKILEKYFEGEILKEFKEDTSIVTLADRESEDVIKKIILGAFPTHSMLGEETGMTENKSDYVWHVDPVDGTRNFSNGIPLFAVSIALVFNNEVIVGVVYNPATRSLFYASKGKGAYLNDKKISVSKDDRDHGIFTISPGPGNTDRKLVRELSYVFPKNVVRSVRDLGSAAVELAYVARGGVEANIQIGRYTYDFAAGVLLVQEAGGMITALDGSPWKFPENYFIASNGVFHDLLVEEIKKQKEKINL